MYDKEPAAVFWMLSYQKYSPDMKKLCCFGLIESFSGRNKVFLTLCGNLTKIKALSKLGKLFTFYFGIAKLDSVPN